ncbi:MAG: hypothetical protein KKE62_17200 [Proteobacteria bacterium]|nr:hypothetical protein [Pseudomonadota bacterium]MBU1386459.1 hypothetical protein [Pseudomonadota bacterium]MBU1544570.1 hypothetical protein [Pseudomonadota bacterium]MBU2431788.1 hypothetical protein [Pseudomonadota bacterium]MBU2481219.1 hypothetical protein [Pseudomonadota bacterium]
MKPFKKRLELLIFIFTAMCFFFSTGYAGTYIYTDTDGKQITVLPKPPAQTQLKKNRKDSKKSDLPPAGMPYEHKEKDKSRKAAEKFK